MRYGLLNYQFHNKLCMLPLINLLSLLNSSAPYALINDCAVGLISTMTRKPCILWTANSWIHGFADSHRKIFYSWNALFFAYTLCTCNSYKQDGHAAAMPPARVV